MTCAPCLAQTVRGAASLPFTTGRRARICVFASGEDAEAARAAGADVVGGEQLVADIQVGKPASPGPALPEAGRRCWQGPAPTCAFTRRALQARGAAAVDFDTCAATREMMPLLARLGRILGPRGLMPNPKLGTVIESGGAGAAMQRMQAGRVQFK